MERKPTQPESKYTFSSGASKVTVRAHNEAQAKALAIHELNRRCRRASVSAPPKWDLSLLTVTPLTVEG